MMRDFPPLYLFSTHIIIQIIVLFSTSYIYDRLFEERLSVIKSIKMILFSIIYGVVLILLYYMFADTLQFTIIYMLYTALAFVLSLLMLYPAQKKGVIFVWAPLCMFCYICSVLALITYNALVPTGIQIWEKVSTAAISYIVCQLLTSLLMILSCKILIKLNCIKYLKKLLDFPKMCMFWFASYVVITIYNTVSNKNSSIYYLTLMFVIAITIFIIILTTRDFWNKEKIKQNEALILQQGHYVKRLENIQQELKVIQHDYKNMISSLYAQASEGDSGSIKSYIETKLMGVDAAVQENINQMNRVSKIQLSELKGLVLTKMIEAEQKGVLLKIEVMNTVSDVAMDKNDLIRSVGILLDNALDEAQSQDKSEVTLILLSESDKFTAAVKNPIQKKPDLSKIWQQGYSTKGENRGLGLTSYKKILNKYANTSSETKVTNTTFLQVLLVSNAKIDGY